MKSSVRRLRATISRSLCASVLSCWKAGCAQDLFSRDRDETRNAQVRDRDKTKTLRILSKTRPKRNGSRVRLKTVSRPRPRDHDHIPARKCKSETITAGAWTRSFWDSWRMQDCNSETSAVRDQWSRCSLTKQNSLHDKWQGWDKQACCHNTFHGVIVTITSRLAKNV